MVDNFIDRHVRDINLPIVQKVEVSVGQKGIRYMVDVS